MSLTEPALRVTEIFFSLQGETSRMGLPTVFIRLTGCPLRCLYCDTAYAFHGGENRSIEEILKEVERHRTRYVTVTGGEPLAQKKCHALLKELCDRGYDVSLETSGAIDVSAVDPRVVKILDLKTPGSGEVGKNRYENLACLTATDQIKFVICDRDDYEWCKTQLGRHQLTERCEVLFSPSHEQLSARELASWILADNLPVRLQIQLHKYLWGNQRGR
ncbi:MAG TPA: 7-carboxy-7-deazaguanine synthase QueE [Gammaproteobacteria bacterium]|nr:7-carboxy-7-deazaguanine synthase QueE [Gammaproteobacteria bacterium]